MNYLPDLPIFTIITFVLITFLAIISMLFFRKSSALRSRAAKQVKYSREILQTQVEVQGSALQQIGQELHENIGQLLAIAKINLNILEEINQNTENQEYILQTDQMISHSLTDLRNLTKGLDVDFVSNFRMQEYLSQELLRLRKTSKFITELSTKGDPFSLGPEIEIVLFRIFQEILDQVPKNTKQGKIHLTLHYEPTRFILQFTYQNTVFATKKPNLHNRPASNSGLDSIRRRSEVIGGTCSIQTNLGERKITIELPLINSQILL
jgi:two-component system NarL family sensor kinase